MMKRLFMGSIMSIVTAGACLAGAFTPGNVAVLSADSASANNTTCRIIELDSATGVAVSTNAISGSGTNAVRISGSATSTGYLSHSGDRTLLTITGANNTNSTANVNTLNPRCVGTLDVNGNFVLQTTYTGTSGNQTRSATTLNNTTWFIGDQGGFYSNGTTTPDPVANVRGVKSFGGTVYGFRASGTLTPVFMLSSATGGAITDLPGLPVGASTMQDFYMVSSGSNGSTYDVLYVLQATSATAGTIYKYSLVSGSWTANGSTNTTFGGFGLAAATNAGGADLYVTSGSGATAANTVRKLTDSAGYNATVSISAITTLYTAPAGTVMKGIDFVPVTKVMQAPSVSIISPSDTASVGTNVSITASTTDDGLVTNVAFYADGNLLGNVTSKPFSLTWTGAAGGSHALTAVAQDNDGLATTSATVNITVVVPNLPPTVAIASPTNNASFISGAPIQIDATATDDGAVTNVAFYADGTLLGASTNAPYSLTWNGAALGSHTLRAVAQDNAGQATTSTAVTVSVVAPVSNAPWKFGVIDDTQWTCADDPAGINSNKVALSFINQINPQFINAGVKFVVQVGDLTENGNDADVQTRAAAAQPLLDAGIGFFPMRGNHETYANPTNNYAIPVFQASFPQTRGVTNTFGAVNFSSPTNVSSDLDGMSYAFDYNSARFVVLDDWVTPSKRVDAVTYQYGYSFGDQQEWISGTLDQGSRGTAHAFVFSHQPLMAENHYDCPFVGYTDANTNMQNAFYASLQTNGVRYYIAGHDHIHQRSLVQSPDGLSSVEEIIGASDSTKFYIPYATTNANWKGQKYRETSLAQELYTPGYYIYTVDGPRVSVDYYSDVRTNWASDAKFPFAAQTNHITPTMNFVKKETFGYSLNGQRFLVAQGGAYTSVVDSVASGTVYGETYKGTTARILAGSNGSTRRDGSNRQLVREIGTGWAPSTLASDALTLWGMADVGTNNLTDTYVISMSYDPAATTLSAIQSGLFGLVTRATPSDSWVNAADLNVGGVQSFVLGAWNSGYTLGACGVDTNTATAWAVVNHASDFAVGPLAHVNAQVVKVDANVYQPFNVGLTNGAWVYLEADPSNASPLRATQRSLGYREVDYKATMFSFLRFTQVAPSNTGAGVMYDYTAQKTKGTYTVGYWKDKDLPVMVGPDGNAYITDGHHTSAGYLSPVNTQSGDVVPGQHRVVLGHVVTNFYNAAVGPVAVDDTWWTNRMAENNAMLYGVNGNQLALSGDAGYAGLQPILPSTLAMPVTPSTLGAQAMTHDHYRGLAWGLADGIVKTATNGATKIKGYSKTNPDTGLDINFVEFFWSDYLRNRIVWDDTKSGHALGSGFGDANAISAPVSFFAAVANGIAMARSQDYRDQYGRGIIDYTNSALFSANTARWASKSIANLSYPALAGDVYNLFLLDDSGIAGDIAPSPVAVNILHIDTSAGMVVSNRLVNIRDVVINAGGAITTTWKDAVVTNTTLTVPAGTSRVTLKGSNTVSGAVTLANGTLVVDGSLTAASLTVAPGATLEYTPGSAPITVTGNLALNGTLNITGSGFGVGTYTLFNCGSLSGSGLVIGSAPDNKMLYAVTNVAGMVQLLVTAAPLRIATLSDVHYFATNLLVNNGVAFQTYLAQDRKLLAESAAIAKAAVDGVIAQNPDIVLVSGDLTKDGELDSHIAFSNQLARLVAGGAKVFVIPGNHDVNNTNAVAYDGVNTIPVDYVTPDEFRAIYAPFGYGQAVARDTNSLSYIVEPVSNLWVVCMDSCQYAPGQNPTAGSFDAGRLAWITNQLEIAKAQGKVVMGMMHHGLMEHYTGQKTLFSDYVLDGYTTVAPLFASYGVKAVFTGHYHANDIVKGTFGGKDIYDIETGSTVTYPCPYRILDLQTDGQMVITTHRITAIDYDLGGAPDFQTYAYNYLHTGMLQLSSWMLQAPPYGLSAPVANYLAPAVTEAMEDHYIGDEPGLAGASPATQAIVTGLLAGDAQSRMLGGAIYSLLTDLTPADNNLTLGLSVATVTGPTNGQVYVEGQTVALSASGNWDVTNMSFYVDGVLVGSTAVPPYTASWTAVQGSHTLTAIAWDNFGQASTSAAVTITVNANMPPTVSLVAPTNSATYLRGQTVSLAATASDDVSVAGVTFTVDGILVGTDTVEPYTASWTATTVGSHVLAAVAQDDAGLMSTSTVTVTVARPAVTHVGASYSEGNANGHEYGVDAFTSIQGAVEAVQAGGTVWVTNGVYNTGSTNLNGVQTRVALTKAVTVRSINGATVTVIEGAADPSSTNGPAAVRCAYVGVGASLVGFTLTKGHTREQPTGSYTTAWDRQVFGGGVFAEAGGLVSDCLIEGNTSSLGGGGAAVESAATLRDCVVAGNRSVYGGGVAALTTGVVENCTLSDNTATTQAGGLYADHAVVRNTIIWSNTAPSSAEYYRSAGTFLRCCAKPVPVGTGNIAVAPQFLGQAWGNYALAGTSPCIDAGTNQPWMTGAKDVDGKTRMQDGNGDGKTVVDIGASEFGTAPRLVITANGFNAPLTVVAGERVQVAITVNKGAGAANKDWWMLHETPDTSWHYYDAAASLWKTAFMVTYKGPFASMGVTPMLDSTTLPVGTNSFFFGVDSKMDGILQLDKLIYDGVQVIVTP